MHSESLRRFQPQSVPINALPSKEAERAEIAGQVEAFLARGGEIREIPAGSQYHNTMEFVTGLPTRRAAPRREVGGRVLIGMPVVLHLTRRSESFLRQRMAKGDFPRYVEGSKPHQWVESEVLEWVRGQESANQG